MQFAHISLSFKPSLLEGRSDFKRKCLPHHQSAAELSVSLWWHGITVKPQQGVMLASYNFRLDNEEMVNENGAIAAHFCTMACFRLL